MAVQVGVLGASGRLGRRVIARLVEDDALQLVGAWTHAGSSALGVDAGTLAGVAPLSVLVGTLPASLEGVEVVIDVSQPEGTEALLARLGGVPLVSGVTGGGAATEAAFDRAAAQAPVLLASNFSAGVHVLADVVARAAAALPTADVEIVEAHHRRKVDAPSGTAILLGRAVEAARGPQGAVHGRHGRTGVRPHGPIGYHAIRGGDVVGEHTVWLADEGERLLLGHVASSRDTFALGALRAAAWLSAQPAGRYTMRHVLGLDPLPTTSGHAPDAPLG